MIKFEEWNPTNAYQGESFKIIMGANSQYQEGCRNWVLPMAKSAGDDARLIAINAPGELRERMKVFLSVIESQLKLTPSRTRETNGLTVIELNDAWMSSPMRYSFLTMLLKIGLFYKHKSAYPGLQYVISMPLTTDWNINLFYRNSRSVWNRIQNNMRSFLEAGSDLKFLDYYNWSQVKPKYEKDIGFINSFYNVKERKFTYRGEVE